MPGSHSKKDKLKKKIAKIKKKNRLCKERLKKVTNSF